jgi:hypothetical protein
MTDPQQGPIANVNSSLNTLSTVLVAAVTATTSVLTLFGVNSDRIWVLLDDDAARLWFLGAGLGAIAAVGLALMSYLAEQRTRVKTALLFAGTCLYLGGLGAAVFGAAQSADTQGRPSIVDVAITPDDPGAVVSFKVVGASVDNSERLGVRLYDGPEGPLLVEAYPRPTAGMVELKASLPVRSSSDELVLKVWTIDEWGQEPLCPEDQANSDVELVEADCVTVHSALGAPTSTR